MWAGEGEIYLGHFATAAAAARAYDRAAIRCAPLAALCTGNACILFASMSYTCEGCIGCRSDQIAQIIEVQRNRAVSKQCMKLSRTNACL